MARLWSVLCCASLLAAEAGAGGFLRNRAFAPGPNTPLDGSVGRKGSEDFWGAARPSTSSPLYSVFHDLVEQAGAAANASGSQTQVPAERPAVVAAAPDKDFRELEVEEPLSDSINGAEKQHEPSTGFEWEEEEPQEPEVLAILRDAIYPGLGADREKVLSERCLPEDMRSFTDRVDKAVGHMLRMRGRNMQLGLEELADLISDTLKSVDESGCQHIIWDKDVIQKGARKLRTLTKNTAVDYGTHIKYEAMKSLVVGGVDIHRELNEFIGAWKLRSHRAAGVPLGVLMRKLAEIQGHDEL